MRGGIDIEYIYLQILVVNMEVVLQLQGLKLDYLILAW
jgi:hypothetical protein